MKKKKTASKSNTKKKPYRRPTITSSEAFYTRALACAKGFVDGDPVCGPDSDPSYS